MVLSKMFKFKRKLQTLTVKHKYFNMFWERQNRQKMCPFKVMW